ncbi:MAG: hypothetical protein JHD35_26520 [Sphingopyxis sp.]|uniref:Uncharacterized protein n=1 Tax=Sphingobium xenophagum TaxID=121428 RepID=A0A401J2D3_SPHXE|nr:hypothetical protein [Sphingobium xenophagum]AOF95328.1 hypothetical protein BSY17_4173 [Sphingobium sp. RAC03]MBJ7442552.1 hypothetical protein [Sphingopyxis sp.]GBH30801.1 hypothetical protein MBESOW_P2056 [Sphingobium xenophagum]
MTSISRVTLRHANLLSAKLVKKPTLRLYRGYSHGMALNHADVINADLLPSSEGGQGPASTVGYFEQQTAPIAS